MFARQPFQQADELPRLGAAVFVAGKHVGEHVENNEAWPPFRQIGVERVVHRCRLDLAFHQRAQGRILADEIGSEVTPQEPSDAEIDEVLSMAVAGSLETEDDSEMEASE